MKTTKSRAARLVLPVALVAFGLVGAGMTLAYARNFDGFTSNGPGMMNGNGFGLGSGGMMNRNGNSGGFAPGAGGMMNRNGSAFGNGGGMMNGSGLTARCTPAAATGQLVRFRAMDSGRMMGGGMMRLLPLTQTAREGTVTLELTNLGTRPHELLVYRLADGQQPGSRTVLGTDRISETGILGEVEPVCTQPADLDGIAAGNIARVTLTLTPGRYEVVCNLPGHYRAGMWATLIVR